MAFLLAAAVLSEPAPRIASLSWVSEDMVVVEIRARGVRSFKEIPVPPRPEPMGMEGRDTVHEGRPARILGRRGEWVRPYSEAIGEGWSPDQAAMARAAGPDGRTIGMKLAARKQQPGQLARTNGWEFSGEEIHHLYLRLDPAPAEGMVRITVPGAGSSEISADRRSALAEGIRINQIGFRPNDPDKSALFTLWIPGGEPVRLAGEWFEVLDEKGAAAGRFPIRLHHDGQAPDTERGEKNAKAPVYALDFSTVNKPGSYRIHLPGIGVSREFPIAEDAYLKPFLTAVKGLYYQRNSIAHTAPWSEMELPRAFHPEDGWEVFASTCSLMDSGNGLNALGADEGSFKNLVAGATAQKMESVWGGYKDAGDWDTRIQHLETTRAILELAEVRPSLLKAELNIPESGDGLPDLIDEARWNIDHFRRMQTPEGGIRGGYEFEEHPLALETSWTTGLRAFAYAPDPWCSWLYAASSARLATVLKPIRPAMADEYRQSAARAYDWAAAELKRLARASYPHQVRDARALAAVELLRLTGEKRYEADAREALLIDAPGQPVRVWGEIDQRESAALLARTGAIPDLVEPSRAALRALADQILGMQDRTSLRLSIPDAYAYPGYSRDTSGEGLAAMVWAHMATGEEKYMKGLLKAVGYGAGINPKSLVYTSGVGHTPVSQPFMLDPYYEAGRMPPGITVYGPLSFITDGQGPWFQVAKPFVHPPAEEWPGGETYFDAFWTIMMCEFTVMQSIGGTSLAWGYLAAEK